MKIRSERSIRWFVLVAALVLSLAPRSPIHGQTEADEPGGDSAPAQAAAEVTPGEDPTQIWSERIVVTATRTELEMGDVPLHATVIDAEAIELAPEYGVADMLRRLPGVNLQGDRSVLVSSHIDGGLAFRGLGATATSRGLVLIDGIPVNEPFASWLIWTQVPRDVIDRIEVLPGGTGIWGNLALSGVVSMITRAPEEGLFGARLRLGNLETGEGTVSYSDIAGDWSGWISANALDTGGYASLDPRDAGPIDTDREKRYGTLTSRLSRAFSSSSALHLGAARFEEDRSSGTRLQTATNEETTLHATLDLVNAGGSSWQARLYGRDVLFREQEPRVNAARSMESLDSRTDVPTDAFGLSAVWFSSGASKHAASVGADVQLTSMDARAHTGFDAGSFAALAEIEGEQQFAGVFVQDVFTPSPRTTLLLGARFDSIRTQDGLRRDTDLTTGAATERVLIDAHTETNVNPSIGVVHEISGELRLRGSVYSGFRAATPNELFVDSLGRNIVMSNPTLEPEKLLGVEAGVDLTPSRRASTRLTGYWSHGEDLIERFVAGRAGPGGAFIEPCGEVQPNGNCAQRRNLGEVRVLGLEVEQTVDLHAHWRLHLAGTLLDTEVTDSPGTPQLVGNRTVRNPNEAVSLTLRYDNPRWLQGELDARWIGERWDDPENEDLLPEQFVVHVSVARALASRWSVSAGVQNLFDERVIVDFSGSLAQLAAPRTAYVGVSFRSR